MSPLGSYRVASGAWIFDWGLNRLGFLLVFAFRMIGMHAAHRALRVILCEGRYFQVSSWFSGKRGPWCLQIDEYR